jgi:tRNA threonylcarbamoyladenosine biosynthesis protein TsaB
MAILLNIDTATEIAIISLSEKDSVIEYVTNTDQKDHASFLQPAIKILFQKADLTINNINAVAVAAGPGSYTGLRVGMASAKGLCYALSIPMITINTLEVMALSSIKKIKEQSALYCPMIDARRMEVFIAVYDDQLAEIIKPCSMILNEESFNDMLQKSKIYFSGSGILKLEDILKNQNAIFNNHQTTPDAMAALSYKTYIKKSFADVAYASPEYLKEFYTPSKPGV